MESLNRHQKTEPKYYQNKNRLKQKRGIFTISLLLFFVFCSQKNVVAESKKLPESVKSEINQKAEEILSKMTDKEKVGQVIHVSIPENKLEKIAQEEISEIKPGGIILFGKNFGTVQETTSLTSEIQSLAKKNHLLPMFISTDQEGGRVIRVVSGVTQFPGAMALGQGGDSKAARKAGFITSYQLRSLGVNMMLAPILDINNNPENPVINTRSFGSDLARVQKIAVSFEEGAREGGALPVIKHFPGHGDTNVDSHTGLPIIHKKFEDLEKLELIPFLNSLRNGARSVMTAHIIYPELDPELPATLSKKILTGLLREKLGFGGLLLTDAMEMDAISKHFPDKKPGVLAILAGADIILLTSWGETSRYYKKQLLTALHDSAGSQEFRKALDRAVKNQIAHKLEFGLLENDPSSELGKYLEEKNKKSYMEYDAMISPHGDFGSIKMSADAIRSYKKEFRPLPAKEKSKTAFILKHTLLKDKFRKNTVYPYVALKSKKEKFKKKKTFIIETETQEDLDLVKKLITRLHSRKYVLLHYGSPFLKFPQVKNLEIIFSFSPTSDSVGALGNSVFGNTIIQPAELILK